MLLICYSLQKYFFPHSGIIFIQVKMIATMNYKKIFILFLCTMFFTYSFGQDNDQQKLDSFSGKFITAIRTHEKQRVYLVTDKSVFTNGESIWFKAFLLNAISQNINTNSRFLFVDLVNEKDSVIKVVVLDAFNKQLNSRIILPESIATGYYWLRAYTRQMAEGDVNNICVKPIYIVDRINDNNLSKPIKKGNSQDTIPTINFYPEGGSVITGINSAVALRVSHLNGMPLSIDGFIKDDHEVVIAHFTTNKIGFGKVDFEPSGYRKYHAVINWHGKEISYPLPPFNFYKGQVSVTKQSTGYKLRILLGDSIYRKDFVTYLIGISKDSLIFASIGRGLYEIPVAEHQLTDGITTFYLFDENFKLLSERSIYVHDNNVRIKAETDKHLYGKRDKVALNISITDANQHPIPSLIAISVTDTIFKDPNEDCALPGNDYTQQAIDNMFLESNECLTENDIDLLMLARNDTYPTLSKMADQPTAMDTDSLLYIKGTVLDTKNEPSANKIITLLFNSGDLNLHSDTTDNAGRFCFPFANYTDSMQFALQVRDLKGRAQNDKILLDNPDYPKVSTPVSLKQYLPVQPKEAKKYINKYYESLLVDDDKHLLPRVTVTNPKKAVNYDQSKRVSSSSVILTSKELNERNSVGNAVLNVGGMHLLNGVLVMNGLTSMKAPDLTSEPLLLINGAEASLSPGIGESSQVLSYLNSLNPKNIDFIEILKGPEGANYGVRGGNGVILVNMSNTSRDPIQNGGNLKTFYAKGVSIPGLFPNVDYQQKNVKPATADTRSTLFWNGSFLNDDTNNATLTFYTSDIPATYKATITGITIHGDIIYKTITFQSK